MRFKQPFFWLIFGPLIASMLMACGDTCLPAVHCGNFDFEAPVFEPDVHTLVSDPETSDERAEMMTRLSRQLTTLNIPFRLEELDMGDFEVYTTAKGTEFVCNFDQVVFLFDDATTAVCR